MYLSYKDKIIIDISFQDNYNSLHLEGGDGVPYLSKREIEAIATRVVNAYQRMVGTAGAMIQRVCPEVLIRNLLGLNITYRTLSIDGSILGMTAFDQVGVRVYENKNPTHFYLDGKTVLIESALTEPDANPGRLHFTLVHEASHQILKMLFPKEYASGINHRHVYCCTDSSIRYGGRQVDWEEWRVNMLTAAILMPLDLLVKQMKAVGLYSKIRMLNRVFAPKEYQAFATVAENLGVSKAALSIRLKQLGLLTRNDLKDPYALVRIEPDEEELF